MRCRRLLRDRLDRQAFHEALEEVWKVIRAANAYIDRQAPWALRKTDKARMGAVLRVLADVLRVIATVLQPFMPESMARMLDQLGVPAEARQLAGLAVPLADGMPLPAPQGVFPRYVEPAGLMLIDSHCHLDYFTDDGASRCAGPRRGGRRGGDGHHRHHAGAVASSLPRTGRSACTNLWCTVGVHPHHAAEAAGSRAGGPSRR